MFRDIAFNKISKKNNSNVKKIIKHILKGGASEYTDLDDDTKFIVVVFNMIIDYLLFCDPIRYFN